MTANAAEAASALPNLVVIGAMKCGTSALHYYLDLHPEVSMSHPKELNFFCDESEPVAGSGIAPGDVAILQRGQRNWGRGLSWYASHFDAAKPVRGEASPLYTSPGFPQVAVRMAATIPDALLVYLIRDPVERMVSHYMHRRASGWERRPIGDAFTAPRNIYVGRSRYHANLAPFLELFGRDRILVLRQEDLLARRRETIRAVFEFAGVDPSFWSPKMERERNPTAAKGQRTRLLWALQGTAAGPIAQRLPQEIKWWIERGSSRRGSTRANRPAVSGDLRAEIADQLRDDVEAIAEVAGEDLSGYLGRQPLRPRSRK